MDKLIKLITEHPELVSLINKETIATEAGPYKKIIYEVLAYGFDLYKDLVNNNDFFKTRAAYRKNMYDAYIKAGFSEEQAFALIIDDNLQLIKSMNTTKVKTENK